MPHKESKHSQEYSEQEIARRMELGLKRSMEMKPKPHKPTKKAAKPTIKQKGKSE